MPNPAPWIKIIEQRALSQLAHMGGGNSRAASPILHAALWPGALEPRLPASPRQFPGAVPLLLREKWAPPSAARNGDARDQGHGDVQRGGEQPLLLVSDRMRSHTHFLRRHSNAELRKHQPSLDFPLAGPCGPLHKSHGNQRTKCVSGPVPHCFLHT